MPVVAAVAELNTAAVDCSNPNLDMVSAIGYHTRVAFEENYSAPRLMKNYIGERFLRHTAAEKLGLAALNKECSHSALFAEDCTVVSNMARYSLGAETVLLV